MSLVEVAADTLKILEAGHYTAPSGRTIEIGAAQRASVAGSRLYTPAEQGALLAATPQNHSSSRLRIEVTAETTQQAAQRLAARGPVAALNFASARNPGGGFLGGAKAQEEDLCRCSGLYPTQLPHDRYYQVNRAEKSLIYTDHLIWSPAVPFFRVEAAGRVEVPFMVSVITSPAPNAGEELRRDPTARPRISEALRRRSGMLLAVAEAQGARRLVLGAWGCGVFRNDPVEVAGIFGEWLTSTRFDGAFDEVVFAVYGRPEANIEAFRARFRAPAE